MKTIIVYGSETGAVEEVANNLAELLDTTAVSAATTTSKALEGCELLILGASTQGLGDLQDDMAEFLKRFAEMDVNIPLGAVFGLGDAAGYEESFVDGIADMADALEAKGIKRIGDWPCADYTFKASRAQQGDTFKGLVIDQDNEADKTEERLNTWANRLTEVMVA